MAKQVSERYRREMRDLKIGLALLVLSAASVLGALYLIGAFN